ncbi:MAG: phytochelatin synthase family protein [Polyangia bacterium]
MLSPAPASFYKRPLPTACIPFASEDGRRLFQEALADGTMAGYFALAEQFHTQADPAFCGLGTLVVVLNALAIDPGPQRRWKGPWRWFSEEHLDCCRPLPEIQRTGLTIPQFVCLARCNGARVSAHYGEQTTLEAFRQAVREAASTPGEPHLVVSYDRATLGQTGSGHFSPVGGYHAGRDQVLILDVARFKYPPHWVALEALFRALLPHDAETGRSRGFVQLWRRSEVAAVCSLPATDASWRALLCELFNAETLAAGTMEELLQRLTRALPVPALELVRTRLFGPAEQPELRSVEDTLRRELEPTEIVQLLRGALPSAELDLGALALFLLALPASVFRCLPPHLRERMEELQRIDRLPPSVREQVEHLRGQAAALDALRS